MNPGILLINLGSPASPSVADVRSYLNQFLMDRHVMDTPWLARRAIVSGFILPFRPKQSAHAYASIWSDAGSPLLLYTEALRASLAQQVNVPVLAAMRYGQPSISHAINELGDQGFDHVVIVPLYPQHADSTVTTSVEHAIQSLPRGMTHAVLPPFYNDPNYIGALTTVVQAHLTDDSEHLLMSYHGLPERHITKADTTGNHCLQNPDCCEKPSPAHATCYRHQVYATSKALAHALGKNPEQYTVTFQSRLGRLPWLQPYTDQTLSELPSQGHKRLAVVCPAFVADNLETLEEIEMQGRKTFMQAGGKSFRLIPCLNDHPTWVSALAKMLAPYLSTKLSTYRAPANADTSA